MVISVLCLYCKYFRLDEIETIENKISEMKIKVTEGENLQTRYKNMITTLTNSNLAKTSKIMQIENDVMQETKQIDRLTQTLSEALKVKKEAKTRLIEVFNLTYTSLLALIKN